MRKPKPPKLVTIAITTTITIIFWIFLTLYRVLTTKPAPSVDPALLEPIDATLDVTSLEKLKNLVFYEEGSFTPPPVNTSALVTPTVSPSPTQTPELPEEEPIGEDEIVEEGEENVGTSDET